MARTVKVVLIGDSGVGKTCICDRVVQGDFSSDSASTVRASFFTLPGSSNSDFTFEIWDTAGQDSYKSLVPSYFRGAAVAILVFDVTAHQSLTSLDNWVALAREHAPADCQFVVLGNKVDLEDQREVAGHLAEERCDALGAEFYLEVSAKQGLNLDDLLVWVEKVLIKRERSRTTLEAPQTVVVEWDDHPKEKRQCC
jgi:small GTP-binding protein